MGQAGRLEVGAERGVEPGRVAEDQAGQQSACVLGEDLRGVAEPGAQPARGALEAGGLADQGRRMTHREDAGGHAGSQPRTEPALGDDVLARQKAGPAGRGCDHQDVVRDCPLPTLRADALPAREDYDAVAAAGRAGTQRSRVVPDDQVHAGGGTGVREPGER
jgi:hypothetical protein